MLTRTTVFSNAVIKIGNTEYTDHSGLVIEEIVDGFGLSGVLSTVMRVTLHTEYFSAEENAEVEIEYHVTGGLAHFPKFYISNRIHKGDSVELVCRCAMQKLDRPFPVSGNDFDENGEMSTVFAIQRIAQQIDLMTSYPDGMPIPKLTEKFLKNNNCLLILEKLSEAWAGYFRIWNGCLTFVSFETPLLEHTVIEEHDKVHTGFRKRITKVLVTGGDETYERGSGDFSATVCIETEFASDDLADNLFSRLNGFIYYPVMKTMCKTFTFPPVSCEVTFPFSDSIYGKKFSINSIKTYPRRSGLYMEMSNNAVREDEWDYSGKTEREIKRLNQLFSELEKGGDEPLPEPDNEPWKRDPDWAAFEAMPHIFYNSGVNPADDKFIDVMVKVISDARTLALTINSENNDNRLTVDWGDGAPAEATACTYYSGDNNIIRSHYKISASHTYSEKGIYYIRISIKATTYRYNIAISPPYTGIYYTDKPPLVIGWKYNSSIAQIMLNGKCDNVLNADNYNQFLAATKFIQFDDFYLRRNPVQNSITGFIYNPFWIEFVKGAYTGINSEEDITNMMNTVTI
jgi:hypothetical protein